MIELFINRENKYCESLRAAAESAARVLGQDADLSAALEFAAPGRMRQLNLKFRQQDKPTDVLSFPNLPLEKPVSVRLPAVRAEDWPQELESGTVFLGDIVICGAVAKKQSMEYGHTEERETVYLFIHGLLHLFGFDHTEESDRGLMREAEEKIIGEMGNKAPVNYCYRL